MPTVPSALKAARAKHRMSQNDLAYMAGIAPRTVRSMEREGGYDCTIDVLLRVAGVLGVPIGTLISHPNRNGQPWSMR